MRIKLHPTAFVAACALACAAWLTARPDEHARFADKYLRAQAISTLFSGSVLVARGDDVLFSAAHGSADIERGVRNDVHTQYRIGSVTKPFTAMLILSLQEEGLLAVTDPICAYLEPCPAAWSALSIHHLLSHTSGVHNLTDREDYLSVTAEPAARDEVITTFRDLPLDFMPGEKFEYSNSNYHLLGAIAEQVTGQSYDDALAQRILAPAGLTATFMYPTSPVALHVAVGYRPTDDGSMQPDSPLDPAWSYSAGALFSTVEDLYRLSRALDDHALLSEDTQALMWTPVKDTYGYGWSVLPPSAETLHRRVQMHSGRTQGYTACFARFPDDDLTAVVLSNNVMADTCGIVTDLIAIELGEPYTMPIARRAIRLDAAVLDRYVGRYRLSETLVIDITREDDVLIVTFPRSPDRFQLFAESETEFFFRTFDAQVAFATDRTGEPTGLTASSNGRSVFAARLDN
jgi:CubicO group peptidase (beta-lactamase class C family)